MLNNREVKSLLSKLCIDLGFCLSPKEENQLLEMPPDDVGSFTDAVFLAEGINPQYANRQLYRQVKTLISEAFQKHYDNHES